MDWYIFIVAGPTLNLAVSGTRAGGASNVLPAPPAA